MGNRSRNENAYILPRTDGRVYVNQPLDLTHTDALGLDLDHTLAVYEDVSVNSLAFEETCRNLVAIKGYPAAVMDLQYGDLAMSRGLIADTVHGNIVKLDYIDRVVRVLSGQKYLKSNDILSIYGDQPHPDPELYQISSPFDLPAGVLYTLLLDLLPPDRTRNSHILGDVVEMLDQVHRFGDLKRRIVSQCDRYVETRPEAGEMIRGFRRTGKKIFLLTNSGYDYAVVLLNHLFPARGRSGNWHSLFDAVVVDADKPGYFRAASRPVPAGPGEHATIWSGGSATALESHLGVAPDRVFFVGDNPVADSAAARARGWRTALVVPELETDPYPPGVARKQDDGRDSGWGSVFWEAASPTRFARVISDSADIFASRVESILARGPEAVFRAV